MLSLLTLCCGAQASCVNWVLSSQVIKMLVSVHTISTISLEYCFFLQYMLRKYSYFIFIETI